MNPNSFNHAKYTGTAGTLTLLGALALALTGSEVGGFRALADEFIATQEAELDPGYGLEYPSFGAPVALSGDTALVASPLDGPLYAGSAFVYVRSGTIWSQQAKLTVSDGEWFDQLGSSVALEGDTALVGAPEARYNGYNTGSAYVFVRTGTNWSQQARLTVSDHMVFQLGCSVALSGDTALVGALSTTARAGEAYVYVRSGTTWSQQAKLTASDGAANDRFGNSVALEGDTALIGTWAVTNVGKAYVFVRSGTTWSQQAKLTASDGTTSDHFGNPVALLGGTALVGRWLDGQGSAYVFVRSGTTWSQQAKLTAGDGREGDAFGRSVALSADTALVGAPANLTQPGAGAGSAYVFVRSGMTWSQQAQLTANDGAWDDAFGYVALSGDTAAVGAPSHNWFYDYDYDIFYYVGGVYVFRLLTAPDGYNRLTAEALTGGAVRLTYVGLPGTNYALDRTFNLKPSVLWTPQETNPAPVGGMLILTNTPVLTTNNFWRMRSVP